MDARLYEGLLCGGRVIYLQKGATADEDSDIASDVLQLIVKLPPPLLADVKSLL